MIGRLVALLLVVSLSLQGLGLIAGNWACEGKVCSTDLLRCCCAQPRVLQHSTCNGTIAAKGCPGKCKCRATVAGKHEVLVAHAKDAFPAPVALDLAIIIPNRQPAVLPVRLPETPLLANPPPVALSCLPRDGTLLRAPPAPLS